MLSFRPSVAAAPAPFPRDDLPNLAVRCGDEPLLLFHGTGSLFERFQPNPRGIFFSEDARAALSYTKIRKTETPRVIGAHLTIRAPWVYVRYGDDCPYSQQIDQSVAALCAAGYDGIHDPVNNVWVAFSPDQIQIVESQPWEAVQQDGAAAFAAWLPPAEASHELAADPDAAPRPR